MDMFVVKRPNPVSSTAASPVARKKARQGDVTCLTYVVQTLYFAAPLPHFCHFYRTSTALFGKITGAVPHLFARKTAPKHGPWPIGVLRLWSFARRFTKNRPDPGPEIRSAPSMH